MHNPLIASSSLHETAFRPAWAQVRGVGFEQAYPFRWTKWTEGFER